MKHPGRTLVFVNAVSATRRLAALLGRLGIPAVALHASQQQRQRLKARATPCQPPCMLIGLMLIGVLLYSGGDTSHTCWQPVTARSREIIPAWLLITQALDRFKKEPNGVLVATDVAARGLDVPDVRCVVHFPLTPNAAADRCLSCRRGDNSASPEIVCLTMPQTCALAVLVTA